MAAPCARFCGPFIPLLFGESVEEVGGSFYLSSHVILTTRCLFAAALTVLSILSGVERWLLTSDVLFIMTVTSAASFTLLGVVSLQHVFGNKIPIIARLAAPLHFMVASWSLYILLEPLQHASTHDKWSHHITYYILPLALVLLDFMFGAQIRFRFMYMLLPLLPVFGYAIYFVIRHDYGSVAMDGARWYATQLPILLTTTVMMFIISRIAALFVHVPPEQKQLKDIDRDFFNCHRHEDRTTAFNIDSSTDSSSSAV